MQPGINHRGRSAGLAPALAMAFGAVPVSASASMAQAASPMIDAEEQGADATTATERYITNAAQFVEAADWDQARRVAIVMTESAFTPSQLSLDVGEPYLLELINTAPVGHQLLAGAFFRTVATQRAETAESYVIAPFFEAIEVFPGKQAVISLVPLVPGTYELRRDVEGRPEGEAFGTVTVSGLPELEFADVSSGPWVQDSSALVEAADWEHAQVVSVELREFSFTPEDVSLSVGQPYQIDVVNVGEVRHEFTAPGFFATSALRNAVDASASFRVPAPREVEVFPGQTTTLYVIPTAPGTFDLVCEIPGHFEAGMFGTITVTVAP